MKKPKTEFTAAAAKAAEPTEIAAASPERMDAENTRAVQPMEVDKEWSF